MTANLPKLELSAPAEITAKAGKTPLISILAYSGGIMNLAGHGDAVVEVEGIEAGDSVTLLADHTNELGAVLGSGTPIKRGGQLYVEGTVSRANESGRNLLAMNADGVRFQASIGAQPTEPARQVKPGETFEANGRTLTAGASGVLLYPAVRLREVTVTPNGADPNTSVSIQATKQTPGVTPVTEATETQDPAAILAGYDKIEAASDLFGVSAVADLREQVRAGISPGELDTAIFAAAKAERKLREYEYAAPRLRTVPPGASGKLSASNGDILEASIASKFLGQSEAEQLYSPAAIEASRRYQSTSTIEAWRAVTGYEGAGSPTELVAAAFSNIRASGFSTISLPTALGNVANRALARMYNDSPATWRSFAMVKAAANFQEQTGVRPSAFGELDEIGAQGEIQHDDLTNESLYKWKLDTYAKQIRVSRQAVINDDLGFIDDVVRSMGPAAMRKLANLIYASLRSAGSFFHGDNGNLNTSNVLSVAGFATALEKMRSQKDERGNYIDIQPTTLLVPPALEQTAREILQSEFTERVAADSDEVRGTGNPFRQAVSLEIEPRLGDDPTTWYLLGSPATNPITVGFLNGKQAPNVEFFGLDSDPNTLGFSWRVYHDFGVAMGDFRAAQKNTA